MENQANFDLNAALAQWRRRAAAAPAFSPENIRELELHLVDSVSKLQSSGLSTEEAFDIAQKRIGPVQTLNSEFAKVNGDRVWLERSLWMAAGLQMFVFSGYIAQTVVSLALAAFPSLSVYYVTHFAAKGVLPSRMLIASLATPVVHWFIVGAAFWRAGKVMSPRELNLSRWVTTGRSAWLLGAALVACGLLLNAGSIVAQYILSRASFAEGINQNVAVQWLYLNAVVTVATLPMIVVWILRRQNRGVRADGPRCAN
jgi:hypothetical protein